MRNKLRKIRVLQGYTQKEIAKAIGIDRSSYSNIELGYKNPSLLVALKIKQFLNYEKDDIFLPIDVPNRN